MPGAILIPAHDEEQALPATLGHLLEGLPADVEVIVACNGCKDATAQVAREYEPRVRVLEIEEASKTAALRAAEREEPAFPRIYLDADIAISGSQVDLLLRALESGALAAEGVPEFDLSSSNWAVRAYYSVWLALHGSEPGDVGCGLYAMSREGRGRFGDFPELIADDGFVRAHFGPGEIRHIQEVRTRVKAPRSLEFLIRVKTRVRLGTAQLAERFPELWGRKRGRDQSLSSKARSLPFRTWPAIPVYLFVQAVTRLRARRQARSISEYRWERDESTR